MEQTNKNIEIEIVSKLNTEELEVDLESISPEHWKVFTDTLKTTLQVTVEIAICRDIQDLINGEYQICTELGSMSIVDGKLIVTAEDEEQVEDEEWENRGKFPRFIHTKLTYFSEYCNIDSVWNLN